MTLWGAIIAAAAVLAGAEDGGVQVRASLDPPIIPFHRQTQYRVEATYPADSTVHLPDLVGQFPGLEVKDIKRDTAALDDGRTRITETYTLEAIWPGHYPLPPAVVECDGQERRAPSPGLRVRDLTEEELAAVEEFAPNAPPKDLPPVWMKYAWTAAGALALFLFAVLGLWLWLARRQQAERAAPPRPPWEVAYERLRLLDQRQLAKAGKFEPFYVDLSSILRYYIEDRFQLHAPEQTTPEFIDAASRSGALSEAHQQLLAGFLRHCDRVKFARYVPGIEEMDRSFEVVLRFVDETVPQPESAPSGGGEAAA